MNAAENTEVAELVQRVRMWPTSMRVVLARQILETIEGPDSVSPSERLSLPSAAEIAAMFKSDKPAPDDATVKQWIDEYRMEKYGK